MSDSNEKKSDELLELLGAAWDGVLDDDSFSRLESIVENNGPAGCDIVVAFSRMQVELAWLSAADRACEKALSRLPPPSSLAATHSASATEPEVVKAPRTRLPGDAGRWNGSRRRNLAAAAALLLSVGVVVWQALSRHSPDAAEGIVVLTPADRMVARMAAASKDASWRSALLLVPGDLLSGGQRLELLEGTAQISMACGADLLMQSPCTIELTSTTSVRLVSGTVTAQVAPWGKGFTVHGSGAAFTDLGTRFAAHVDAEGNCQVHVFEGLVSAESLLGSVDEQPVLVKSGQAVEWDDSRSLLRFISINRSQFKESLDEFRPLLPIDVANTGRGASIGASDPRWRITAGHASGGRFPMQAIVSPAASGHVDSGLSQSQWISVPGGTSRGVEQYTQYTFATEFDLSGVDPDTVQLIGYVVVDNRIQEVRLNGKSVNLPPWQMVSREDFQKARIVTINQGFVSGVNQLEMDVINGSTLDGRTHNPMALRVEWQAFGCAEGG